MAMNALVPPTQADDIEPPASRPKFRSDVGRGDDSSLTSRDREGAVGVSAGPVANACGSLRIGAIDDDEIDNEDE